MWRGQVTGPLSQGLFLCRAGPGHQVAVPDQLISPSKVILNTETKLSTYLKLSGSRIFYWGSLTQRILLFTLSYAKKVVNRAQTHILLYKNIKRTDKQTNGQTGTDMEKGVDARTLCKFWYFKDYLLLWKETLCIGKIIKYLTKLQIMNNDFHNISRFSHNFDMSFCGNCNC